MGRARVFLDIGEGFAEQGASSRTTSPGRSVSSPRTETSTGSLRARVEAAAARSTISRRPSGPPIGSRISAM